MFIRKFYFIFFFLLFFSLGITVKASLLVNQTLYADNDNTYNGYYYITDDDVPTNTYVQTAYFRISNATPGKYLGVYFHTGTSNSTTALACNYVSTSDLTEYQFTSPEPQLAVVDEISVGHTIVLEIVEYNNSDCTSQYVSQFDVWGTTTNPLTSEFLSSGISSDFDPYLVLYSGLPVEPSLSFQDPSYNSTIPVGDYSFAGSCIVDGSNRLAITDCQYWQAPSTSGGFDIDCTSGSWSATSTAFLGTSQKCILDLDTLYGSYATATSQVIYIGSPTSTPEDLGLWGNLINALFVPNQTTLNDFTNGIPEALADKSPFGYFYALQESFSDLAVATTTLDLSVSVPLGGTTTTFTILDTSDTSLQNVASHFRWVFQLGIWLSLIIYIYHTLREMEL